MRKQRGITLIALVITIVILVILSAVAIYLALGNNGILNKAKEAKNETLKQTATEKMNLKITNMQIETYGEEQRMPTLQEFADGLCEDDEIQYVQLESKKVGTLSKIEVGEAESIFTKLKEYPYEFEINDSLQLASIDGIQVATNDTDKNSSVKNYDEYVINETYTDISNSDTFVEVAIYGKIVQVSYGLYLKNDLPPESYNLIGNLPKPKMQVFFMGRDWNSNKTSMFIDKAGNLFLEWNGITTSSKTCWGTTMYICE